MTVEKLTERLILNYIERNQAPTTAQILNAIPYSGQLTHSILKELIQSGLIRTAVQGSPCRLTDKGRIYRAILNEECSTELRHELRVLREKHYPICEDCKSAWSPLFSTLFSCILDLVTRFFV